MRDVIDRLQRYHRAATDAAELAATYPIDCWQKARALAAKRLAESCFQLAVIDLAELRPKAAPAPPAPPAPAPPVKAKPAPLPFEFRKIPLDATPSMELISAARDVAKFGLQDVPPDQDVRIPARALRVLGVAVARLKR